MTEQLGTQAALDSMVVESQRVQLVKELQFRQSAEQPAQTDSSLTFPVQKKAD